MSISCQQKGCNGLMYMNDGCSVPGYDWAQAYKCNSCNGVRYMCNVCINSDNAMVRRTLHHKTRLCRHNRLYHDDSLHQMNNTQVNEISPVLKDPMQQNKSSPPKRDGLNYCVPAECKNNADDSVRPRKIMKVDEHKKVDKHKKSSASEEERIYDCLPEDCYDNGTSFEYFKRNSDPNNPCQGPAYMVGLAIIGTTSGYKQLKDHDIILHLLLAKFVSNLTRNQRVELGFIIEMIIKKYDNKSEDGHDCDLDKSTTQDTIVTRIPSSETEFARMYLRGPKSILKNIPMPKVKFIENHSYVSVKQCAVNFLSMDNYPGKISHLNNTIVKSVVESNIGKAVYARAIKSNPGVKEEDILVLLGLQWSDDFEPNSSSKSNRGSVWIKTVSFISDRLTKNDIVNTYPISIGNKAPNHDVIESLFVNECNDLGSGRNNVMYCSRLKRNVHVHFEIIACLGDQPERRSMNFIMLGNSTHSARFRYSANLNAICLHLPPCPKCFTRMKNCKTFLLKQGKCKHCVNWEMNRNSSLLHYDPPKDYPKEMLANTYL